MDLNLRDSLRHFTDKNTYISSETFQKLRENQIIVRFGYFFAIHCQVAFLFLLKVPAEFQTTFFVFEKALANLVNKPHSFSINALLTVLSAIFGSGIPATCIGFIAFSTKLCIFKQTPFCAWPGEKL